MLCNIVWFIHVSGNGMLSGQAATAQQRVRQPFNSKFATILHIFEHDYVFRSLPEPKFHLDSYCAG